MLVPRHDIRVGQPFPFPERDFGKLRFDRGIVAGRESDKWGFMPPGGESYAQVTVRIRQWYETVDKDTVVAAHGGTARALIAQDRKSVV